MERFSEYVEFWLAASVVFAAVFFVGLITMKVYDNLRAKYIVWMWKRRK